MQYLPTWTYSWKREEMSSVTISVTAEGSQRDIELTRKFPTTLGAMKEEEKLAKLVDQLAGEVKSLLLEGRET